MCCFSIKFLSGVLQQIYCNFYFFKNMRGPKSYFKRLKINIGQLREKNKIFFLKIKTNVLMTRWAIQAKGEPLVVCLYLLYNWISYYQEEEGWDPINRLNVSTFLCPSQIRPWISISISCLYVFNDLRWEVVKSLYDHILATHFECL